MFIPFFFIKAPMGMFRNKNDRFMEKLFMDFRAPGKGKTEKPSQIMPEVLVMKDPSISKLCMNMPMLYKKMYMKMMPELGMTFFDISREDFMKLDMFLDGDMTTGMVEYLTHMKLGNMPMAMKCRMRLVDHFNKMMSRSVTQFMAWMYSNSTLITERSK
jgi:hypothetical protein